MIIDVYNELFANVKLAIQNLAKSNGGIITLWNEGDFSPENDPNWPTFISHGMLHHVVNFAWQNGTQTVAIGGIHFQSLHTQTMSLNDFAFKTVCKIADLSGISIEDVVNAPEIAAEDELDEIDFGLGIDPPQPVNVTPPPIGHIAPDGTMYGNTYTTGQMGTIGTAGEKGYFYTVDKPYTQNWK
jgi:hypothetical protein